MKNPGASWLAKLTISVNLDSSKRLCLMLTLRVYMYMHKCVLHTYIRYTHTEANMV